MFVLGIPLNAMKKWFQNNSGYVRQLVIPYYEELTVRENLVLSANMQLPPGTTFEQLLERVEQVIEEVRAIAVSGYVTQSNASNLLVFRSDTCWYFMYPIIMLITVNPVCFNDFIFNLYSIYLYIYSLVQCCVSPETCKILLH